MTTRNHRILLWLSSANQLLFVYFFTSAFVFIFIHLLSPVMDEITQCDYKTDEFPLIVLETGMISVVSINLKIFNDRIIFSPRMSVNGD